MLVFKTWAACKWQLKRKCRLVLSVNCLFLSSSHTSEAVCWQKTGKQACPLVGWGFFFLSSWTERITPRIQVKTWNGFFCFVLFFLFFFFFKFSSDESQRGGTKLVMKVRFCWEGTDEMWHRTGKQDVFVLKWQAISYGGAWWDFSP